MKKGAKFLEIKTWYLTKYSEDILGVELNWDITFNDLYNKLKNGGDFDFYEYIGVSDSAIRERIFEKLSEILKKPYGFVYDLWLK